MMAVPQITILHRVQLNIGNKTEGILPIVGDAFKDLKALIAC